MAFQIVNFFPTKKAYSVLCIMGEGPSTSKIKSTKNDSPLVVKL